MENNLLQYYADRANEYEKVYSKPERQNDILKLKELLSALHYRKRVFEIACGTGYWTECIAKSALSIHGIDVNPEVLAIARSKNYGNCCVTFEQKDAFSLKKSNELFDAGFAGFWWSHVPKSQLAQFVKEFSLCLEPGSSMYFVDNRYVEGSNTPISRTDSDGNTYQLRSLETGESYEVIKNFVEPETIRIILGQISQEVVITELQYFWMAICKTK